MRVVWLVAAFVAGTLTTGVAWAATTQLQGCADLATGNLRVDRHGCTALEEPVAFPERGPAGPMGPAGVGPDEVQMNVLGVGTGMIFSLPEDGSWRRFDGHAAVDLDPSRYWEGSTYQLRVAVYVADDRDDAELCLRIRDLMTGEILTGSSDCVSARQLQDYLYLGFEVPDRPVQLAVEARTDSFSQPDGISYGIVSLGGIRLTVAR